MKNEIKPKMNINDYKNRKIFDSFYDAIHGVWLCIKTERNMRIHTVMAAYVLFFAPFIGVNRGEYAVLMVTIAVMITSEAFNTSIEKLCDYTCKNQNRFIGMVKDIAAGAVFISAFFAVCVGIIILYRPKALWILGTAFLNNPVYLLILAVVTVASIDYIIKVPMGIKAMLIGRRKD